MNGPEGARGRRGARPAGTGGRGAAPGQPEPSGRAQERATAGFDRLRPRGTRPGPIPPGPAHHAMGRDAHGKRALYSGVRPTAPVSPGLTVECSRCGRTSALNAWRALRMLTPSVHLPVIRARHPSLVRCPTCRRLSWVRIGLRGRPAN